MNGDLNAALKIYRPNTQGGLRKHNKRDKKSFSLEQNTEYSVESEEQNLPYQIVQNHTNLSSYEEVAPRN